MKKTIATLFISILIALLIISFTPSKVLAEWVLSELGENILFSFVATSITLFFVVGRLISLEKFQYAKYSMRFLTASAYIAIVYGTMASTWLTGYATTLGMAFFSMEHAALKLLVFILMSLFPMYMRLASASMLTSILETETQENFHSRYYIASCIAGIGLILISLFWLDYRIV